MALTKCKECGKEVSTKAEACPNCGAVLRNKTGCLGCLTYLVVGFIVLIVLGAIASLMTTPSSKTATPSSKPEAGFNMPSIGRQIVTLDAYQRIQNGMSYSQVIAIIGASGEEMSRNKMAGVPGVMESVETVMYQWVNSSGSNMNAIFQNSKLVQKAQFGLK